MIATIIRHVGILYSGCVKSLGMENQAISNAQVTASSQMDNTHSAREARLHSKSDGNQRGGWVALKNDLNQWLQVDLGTFTRVTRVATQGRDGYDQWVTKYRLQYSDNEDTFHSFKEIGSNFAKVWLLKFGKNYTIQYMYSSHQHKFLKLIEASTACKAYGLIHLMSDPEGNS